MALTAQETQELLKLVQAQVLCTSALKKMAATLKTQAQPFSDEFRTRFASAWADIAATFNSTASGMGRVAQVTNNLFDQRVRFPYPQNLDVAKGNLADAASRLASGIGQLGTAPLAPFSAALVDAQAASALLQSFNIALPYAQPLPDSYPRVIGPHGDYDKAQNAAFHALEYFDEGLLPIFASFHPSTTPTWPADATEPYTVVLDSIANMFFAWAHGTALTTTLELPDDAATIASDTAHGSGLRPASFFRVLLAHEYFMSPDHTLINFAQRGAKDGINASLILIFSYTGLLLSKLLPVAPNFVAVQLGGSGSFSSDFGIIWNAMDAWSHAVLAFFYEIPAPPVVIDPSTKSVIPPDFFTAENAKLDAVIAEAQQAAADALKTKALLAQKVGTSL